MKEKAFNISVAVLIAVALALTIFNYTNEDVLLEPPEMGMADRFGGVGAYPNYPASVVSSDPDEDLGCSAGSVSIGEKELEGKKDGKPTGNYIGEGVSSFKSMCSARTGEWKFFGASDNKLYLTAIFNQRGG